MSPLKNFRRFENYIAQAVLGFPEPVIIRQMTGLNLETASFRLRNAISDFLKYEFKSELLDVNSLKEIRTSLVVRLRYNTANKAEYIILGPRVTMEETIPQRNSPEDIIKAIQENKIIPGQLVVSPITLEERENLQHKYGCQFVEKEGKIYVF